MSLLEISTHTVKALNWHTKGFNQNHADRNHSRLPPSFNDSFIWLVLPQVRVGLGPASNQSPL